MIKSVTLRNFQSHKNTTVKFCPGVNAIVGKGDHGKTAILRGIDWVASNKPSGTAFRSTWGGDTEVELKIQGNHTVVRHRGKSKNHYIVDGKTEEAFNTGVPTSVASVVGLTPVNWHKQFDAPFLLAATSSEAARQINEAVRLDTIGTASAHISAVCRRLTASKRDAEERIDALKKQIDSDYGDLAGLASLDRSLQEHVVQLQKTANERKHLSVRVEEIERLKERVGRHLICDGMSERCAEIKAIHIRAISVDAKGDALQRTVDAIIEMRSKQARLDDLLIRLKKQMKKLMPRQCPLCKTILKGKR